MHVSVFNMFSFAHVFIFLVGTFVFFYYLDFITKTIRMRKLLHLLPTLEKRYRFFSHTRELFDSPENFFKKLRRWNLTNFPLYTLNPSYIMGINICGPNEIEAVTSSIKHLEKAPIYLFMDKWLREGLLTSTGAKWQTRRKILTPAFHFSILQQFIVIFNKEATNLTKRLEKECQKPYTDVLPLMSDVTLFTINETAMGIVLDVNNEEDKKYKASVYEVGKLYFSRLMNPSYYMPIVWYLTSSGRRELKLVKFMHKFTENVIKQRSKNFEEFVVPTENESDNDNYSYSKKKKLAMLDLLLNAKFKDGTIDDDGIRDEVNTFMFEGHDTTAMSLTFTLMLLACHREIQDEIYQEIVEVIGTSEADPSYNDLQEFQYMERCIKESLRLYPSVPFIGRTLSEDVQTKSGILPKGAICHIHIFDLHRNPNVWPEPEVFNPDRFLPENCKGRHPFAYLPFSAGPRNCIGQRFAILEIKSVLCHILQKFILEPVDTPETLVLVQDLVLRPKNGVKVKFVLRSQ